MGKLALRKPFKLIFLPFNFLGAVIVWIFLDVSWREAWTGELETETERTP